MSLDPVRTEDEAPSACPFWQGEHKEIVPRAGAQLRREPRRESRRRTAGARDDVLAPVDPVADRKAGDGRALHVRASGCSSSVPGIGPVTRKLP